MVIIHDMNNNTPQMRRLLAQPADILLQIHLISLPDIIDDDNLGLSRLGQEGNPQWRFLIQPELQQTQAQLE